MLTISTSWSLPSYGHLYALSLINRVSATNKINLNTSQLPRLPLCFPFRPPYIVFILFSIVARILDYLQHTTILDHVGAKKINSCCSKKWI